MLPGRRPSLLDGGYPPPPATNPGATERATPGPAAPARPLLGLAPGEVYPAGRSPARWWALTPPFHPYRTKRLGAVRRCVSVALSGGSPLLGVTQHPALWSSDFPRAGVPARGHPACLDPRSPYQRDTDLSTTGHLGTGRSYAGSGWRRVSMPRFARRSASASSSGRPRRYVTPLNGASSSSSSASMRSTAGWRAGCSPVSWRVTVSLPSTRDSGAGAKGRAY